MPELSELFPHLERKKKKVEISNFKSELSKRGFEVWNFKFQIWNFKLKFWMWHFKCRIPDRAQTWVMEVSLRSELGLEVSDKMSRKVKPELEGGNVAGGKYNESSQQDCDPGQETKWVAGRTAHGLIFHGHLMSKWTSKRLVQSTIREGVLVQSKTKI
jgi:hypothetical protein